MGDTSQADLIRQDIERRLAEEFDFSKASNKQIAVKEFVENNPELNTTPGKLQKAYYPILKEYAGRKGIKVASRKKQLLKPNPQMIGGDMEATINPVPQIENSQPQIAMNQPSIPGEPQQMMVQHDIEGVKASINAFYLVVKSFFAPQAELLSEEEKKSLGSIWLPIFNKYLQNEKSIILVAVASSIGIVAPKLMKGRPKKKEQKKESTQEEKQLDPTLEKKDGFDV